MQLATVLVVFALGVLLGAVVTYLSARGQAPQPQQALDMRPVSDELERLRAQLDEMDADRAVALSALASQVQTITRTSTRLTDRTDQLISALRSPQTRGRWGEVQLQLSLIHI